jgi:uncharacterized protein (TIGR02598 family)
MIPLRTSPSAFSLVEVVMALGITAFCMISLMGLFVVGLKSSKESSEMIEAANIASMIIQQRRSAPTTENANRFVLPVLNQPRDLDATTYLDKRGNVTTAADAAYRLSYSILTNTSRVPHLSVRLTAPPTRDPNKADISYEVHTHVALP